MLHLRGRTDASFLVARPDVSNLFEFTGATPLLVEQRRPSAARQGVPTTIDWIVALRCE
jgi:hypothetical protein